MPSPTKEKPRAPTKVVRNLIALAVVGGIVLSALVAVRFTLYVPYRIPSASMMPTLEVGARVFANPSDKNATRGAVMVFEYPEHPSQLFVKRVVGVSGDKITVKNGRISINGWEVPHCEVGRYVYKEGYQDRTASGTLELEYLGDSMYLVFHERRDEGDSLQGPWTVKPHEYFVMGDNRDNAHDSRFWFSGAGGGVPFENTKGRVRIDPVHPSLPEDAAGEKNALEECLKRKPLVTSPPPSSSSSAR